MGTRASIILKDEHTTLFFYRHSDGYPECTGESLKDFVAMYKFGNMRNNVQQSAGWLVLKGHFEYLEGKPATEYAQPAEKGDYSAWKVGAYEPTDQIHSDVEYIYIIDLEKMTLNCRQPNGSSFWDKPTLKNTVPCSEFKTVRFGLKVVA